MNYRKAGRLADAILNDLATALPDGPWIFANALLDEKSFCGTEKTAARRWLVERFRHDEEVLARVPFT
jgi:hypothetical protein